MTIFPRILLLFLFVFTLAGCSKPPYENVDAAGLKALQAQGVALFDIRRHDEWRQTGVVKGSQMLTFVDAVGDVNPDFMDKFAAHVGKNDAVALICRTGNRTDALARELMERHGYTRVYNVEGGITAWISGGNPVVKP